MNDKKRSGPPRFVKFFFFGAIAIFGMSAIVMLLWNAILPSLLGVKLIGYWQAMGLLVLCKILFGGFRPGGPPGRRFGPPKRVRERFMNMSEEEKEQFKEQWKSRCNRG